MKLADRTLLPRLRPFVVAGPFVLAAALALVFDVLRDIPPSYGCGDAEPAGHDAAVAAYRSGAIALHLIAIASTLGAIAVLSAFGARGRISIGRLTIALVLVVVGVSMALVVSGNADWLGVPLLLVLIGFVWLAEPFGAQATGIAAALLLVAAGRWAHRASDAGRSYAACAALWVLALLVGAHLLLVELQGHGAFLC